MAMPAAILRMALVCPRTYGVTAFAASAGQVVAAAVVWTRSRGATVSVVIGRPPPGAVKTVDTGATPVSAFPHTSTDSLQDQAVAASSGVVRSRQYMGWSAYASAKLFFSPLKTDCDHHHSFANRLAARTSVMTTSSPGRTANGQLPELPWLGPR